MQQNGFAGIVTAVLGNIAVAIAISIQKQAKRRLVRLAINGVPVPHFRNQLWWVGVLLLIFGECSNFIAYGLAPASVVSPMGVLALVSNCIIPPLLFDQMPDTHTTLGTTVAVPGMVLMITSGQGWVAPVTDPSISNVGRLYIVSTVVVGGICAAARPLAEKKSVLQLLLNVIITSILGAYFVFAIKCISPVLAGQELVAGTSGPVLLLCASGVLQIFVLVDVLQYFAMWQVVPYHTVFFTGLVAAGSDALFHEFATATIAARWMFLAGWLLSIIGVLISAKPHDKVHISRAVFRDRVKSALGPPQIGRQRRKRKARQNRKAKGTVPGDSSDGPSNSNGANDSDANGTSAGPSRPDPDQLVSPSPATPPAGQQDSHRSNRSRSRSRTQSNRSNRSNHRSRSRTAFVDIPVASYRSESYLVPLDRILATEDDWLDEFPETDVEEQTYLLLPRRWNGYNSVPRYMGA